MSDPKKEMPAVVALVLCLVLVFGPLAIGEIADFPELKTVGYSVFVGVVFAFLGYLKTDPQVEDFDAEKFVITPITGLFVGFAMAFYGLDYTNAIIWLANIGVLSLIEFAGKALVRRLWASEKAG